jgi:hypothetical protein
MSTIAGASKGAVKQAKTRARSAAMISWGGAVRGEHDALDAGPDEAHLVEQGQVFVYGGAWTCDGDREGPCAHALQSDEGSGREFDGDTRSREEIYDGLSDRVIASDDEDSTHRQDSWRMTSMLVRI